MATVPCLGNTIHFLFGKLCSGVLIKPYLCVLDLFHWSHYALLRATKYSTWTWLFQVLLPFHINSNFGN